MSTSPAAPGLYFEAIRPAAEQSPLRTDVAGFAGPARRGPIGAAVRVSGWREYLQVFGGLRADRDLPLAVKGYFDNGGEVAWIIRLSAADAGADAASSAEWDVQRAGPGAKPWQDWDPAVAGFRSSRFRIEATSPGPWGDTVRVEARFRSFGTARHAEVDLVVHAADEPDQRLIALDPADLAAQVAARSSLVRLVPLDALAPAAAKSGPQLLRWDPISLRGGAENRPNLARYLGALAVLGDRSEVALTVFPDLIHDLGNDAASVQSEAVAQAEALHDRLALIDLPPALTTDDAITWADATRSRLGDPGSRAGAAYHPYISVADPLGGVARPLRTIAPGGHVAGLISRLDRERGAQHTPANATLEEVTDVVAEFDLKQRAALNEAGVNLLLCKPGQGVQVWGGRTLLERPEGRYIAHRRLIHRLVRAVRRTAEPLVFETNGPALWLALTRAATTVLLEAWRAGGLKGDRAEEAFQVRCDAANNPQDQQDLGLTLCEIALAPAVPMEFITLRVALSAQGTLDVFES